MFDTEEPIRVILSGGSSPDNVKRLEVNYHGTEPVIKNVKAFIIRHSFDLLNNIPSDGDHSLTLHLEFKVDGEWFAFSLNHPSEIFTESVINPLAHKFDITYRDLCERLS